MKNLEKSKTKAYVKTLALEKLRSTEGGRTPIIGDLKNLKENRNKSYLMSLRVVNTDKI